MHLFAISTAILYAASGVAGYGYHAWSGPDCDGIEIEVVNSAKPGFCYDLTGTKAGTIQVVGANPPDQLCYYVKTGCRHGDAFQRSLGDGCYIAAGSVASVKFTGDCWFHSFFGCSSIQVVLGVY